MKILRHISLLFSLGVAALSPLRAEVAIDELAFRDLVRDLAPKVTLFAEIWRLDPSAILYGGTSRDFLYWVMGQLNEGKTPDYLRSLNSIDIREIVGRESDVDVVSHRTTFFATTEYGVRKIDPIDPDRLNPATKEGRSEIDQGYIPLEKIELALGGLRPPGAFGDGVKEMLSGKISFHSTEGPLFWQTIYAEKNLNHPVFLALRYLRIRAMHWYRTHGSGLPDRDKLLDYDQETKNQIRRLIQSARVDAKLRDVLGNQDKRGLGYLNGTILKGFRSYTNLTAAYLLFVDAGFLEFQKAFPEIETINQFLYLQYRDAKTIEKNFKDYGTSPESLFVPADEAISGLKLLHGTRKEESYRAILFQNALPSDDGNAGAGLYGADLKNKQIAIDRGGDEDHIVEFSIAHDAKVIDITQGAGKDLFETWSRANPEKRHDAFATAFGADILKYPYPPYPYAFVVKNSAVLIKRQGLVRKLVTVSEALAIAEHAKTFDDFEHLIGLLHLNAFSRPEVEIVFEGISKPQRSLWISEVAQSSRLSAKQIQWFIHYCPENLWAKLLDQYAEKLKREISGPFRFHFYSELLTALPTTGRDMVADLIVNDGDKSLASSFLTELIVPSMFLKPGELFLSEEKFQAVIDKLLQDPELHPKLVKQLTDLFTFPLLLCVPVRAHNNWVYERALTWISKILKAGLPAVTLLRNGFFLLNPPKNSGLIAWRERPEFSEWMMKVAASRDVPVATFLTTMVTLRQDGNVHSQELLTLWLSELLKKPMSEFDQDNRHSRHLIERFILVRNLHSPECLTFMRARLPDTEFYNQIILYLTEHSKHDPITKRAISADLAIRSRPHSIAFDSSSYLALEYFAGQRIEDPETAESLLTYIEHLKPPTKISSLRDLFTRLIKPHLASSEFAQRAAIKLAEKWVMYRDQDRLERPPFFPDLLTELRPLHFASEKVQSEAERVFKAPYWQDLWHRQASEHLLDCGGSLARLMRDAVHAKTH